MPTFDISGLGRKTGGSGSGILADQLTILQNSLSKDGFLSPGDYDVLIDMARKLSLSPGLSADQRSNYQVKISEFEKEKAVNQISQNSDIKNMNSALDNEHSQDVLAVGNNPEQFLKGRSASLEAKLNDLSEIIQRRDSNGQDTSEHMQEFNQTLRDYQDVLNTQQALDAWNKGDKSNPVPGFAAYVSTNSRGEITDVAYAPYGSKTGYAETNGMVNGFQVFGKINAKQNGSNVFVLGNQRFSAPDFMSPDPANPGSMKVQRLVAESMQSGDAYKRGQPGYLNMGSDQIQTQSYVPRDSWAKGIDGTLYYRRPDGGYSKYLNFTPPDINPKDVLTLPKVLEQSISRRVDQTVDGLHSINPNDNLASPQQPAASSLDLTNISGTAPTAPTFNPQGANFNPQEGQPTLVPSSPAPASQPAPVSQSAPTPVQRSPQNPIQYAKQTINKAGNFFKDLFS